MKLKYKKKGFTLIELLVVITIIGILATWATAVYTSQIQKARDTTRITDMNAFRWWLEQTFQDISMYPGKATTKAATTDCGSVASSSDSSVDCIIQLWFLNSLPKDPKDGQPWNGSSMVYMYNNANLDWVENQQYEISSWVESNWFKSSKAATDWWNDANRIEFWVPWAGIETCTNWTTACTGDSISSIITTLSCSKLNNITGNVVIRWNCPQS